MILLETELSILATDGERRGRTGRQERRAKDGEPGGRLRGAAARQIEADQSRQARQARQIEGEPGATPRASRPPGKRPKKVLRVKHLGYKLGYPQGAFVLPLIFLLRP